MGNLQWSNLYSVGIKLIDQQHMRLFAIMNELVDARENSLGKEKVEKIIADILDYTQYHFSSEEKFFKIHPDYDKHCEIHRGFLRKAVEISESYSRSQGDISKEILDFLVKWLKSHVLHTDVIFFRELGYFRYENEEESVKETGERGSRIKVLIVDDTADQRMLLRMILERENYDVLEAENGIDALQICDRHSDIRFMVTDLQMPGMDGFELIRKIREEQIHYMYIIVVTVIDEKASVIDALSKGANDFLTKPVLPEELTLRLQGGLQLLRLETQDELIFSMAKLADYRSEETGLHLDRVREYTLILGHYLSVHHPEMGVTAPLANEISRVSPLHDIGKVGIADNILKKPGRYTPEEYEIMKDHTKIGGNLISDIYMKTNSVAMRLAFEIAMYHHEHWDGNGYPAGLAGNGIPVAARIMALADVYDALTTERVYKKAFEHEKAKAIILEGKGGHFDPRIVDGFLALEEKFIELKNLLRD